jgi:acyl-CoA-binding protein
MEVSFPDRYHLAVAYFDQTFGNLEETTKLEDMQKLAFYALRQQAEKGPCKEPAPYVWNVTAKYKHSAWCQLGNMSTFEAMVYFVKQLEEVCGPDWLSPKTTAAAGDEPEPPVGPDVQLNAMSADELRAEVVRLRQLLQQNGISFAVPAVSSPTAAAPEDSKKPPIVADIPQRELRPNETAAPPEKPTPSSAESSSSRSRGDAQAGPVYYSSQKMGWLEWLGVTSAPQDSRII